MTGRRLYKINIRLILFITAIILACILLYNFNPEHISLFPKCSFYMATGLECPACGSQRAIHAILNGNFHKGLCYNPFIIISLPYATSLIILALIKRDWAIKIKKKLLCNKAVYTYVALFVAWWILRNII